MGEVDLVSEAGDDDSHRCKETSRQRAPERDFFVGENRIVYRDEEKVDQKDNRPAQNHVDLFHVKFDSEIFVQSLGEQGKNRVSVHEDKQTGQHQKNQQRDGDDRAETDFKISGNLVAAVQLIGVVGDPDQGKFDFRCRPESADQKDEIQAAGQSAFKGCQKRVDKRIAGEFRVQNLRKYP